MCNGTMSSLLSGAPDWTVRERRRRTRHTWNGLVWMLVVWNILDDEKCRLITQLSEKHFGYKTGVRNWKRDLSSDFTSSRVISLKSRITLMTLLGASLHSDECCVKIPRTKPRIRVQLPKNKITKCFLIMRNRLRKKKSEEAKLYMAYAADHH